MLRLLPGQAAAERAAAAAKFHGHEIVVALRKPWTGETHQHAALVDPGVEAFADLRRQRADIGHHDHRQFLVEELRDHLLRRALVAEPHVGERRQRAGQIEGRGEQGLRGIAGRARDDADGAAAPALVEQLHCAGGALAGNLQPRDVVAQLDRQIERSLGLMILRREAEARLADRRALGIERAHAAGGNAAVGAQHLHRHLGRGVFGCGQRHRRGIAAFENRQRAIADGLAEVVDELGAASGIDAVREPGDLGIAGRLQEAVERGERIDPVDRIGFGRKLPQRDARGTGRHDGDVAGGFGERHQRHAAAVGVGIGDQLVGGADAGIPARGCAPAVVEQDHQRRGMAGEPGLRIPDRAGGGEDHECRGGKAQRGQPPGRARGRLFLGRDVEQQPRRRKFDAPRPRRHHPQQPPQGRQAQEPEQQHRFGKGERQTRDHEARPALTFTRVPPLLTIMPPCRNNNSSAAERLVVWVVNSQSSLLVSSRIWSRCNATRAT